ncbi:MAG: nucleoside phosphorylase [Azospirillaceae bacterium]|nr:nucleoside phosphorylase [Azospirillaceae bacterium]
MTGENQGPIGGGESAADKIGIVAGLASEAALAARLPGTCVVCSGGRPDRAAALAAALADQGVRGLISFGIAGGLVADAVSGLVIVAEAVVADDERYDADAGWSIALARRLEAGLGVIAASRVIVADPAAKRALQQRHGGVVVDMETLAVARAAARRGLPWTAIRAVADPVTFTLPPAALVALTAAGRPDLPAVLAAIARRPGQIPDLIRLARASQAAHRGLLGGVNRLVGGGGLL